ncbi:hypothetical protein AA313_de0201724 [Arthrobotrys entomopaga]|nr:hypothetical protein AA313_de0201724 [Arthrobotrys entomopaga]
MPSNKGGTLSSLRTSHDRIVAPKHDEADLDAQVKVGRPSSLLLQAVTAVSTEISARNKRKHGASAPRIQDTSERSEHKLNLKDLSSFTSSDCQLIRTSLHDLFDASEPRSSAHCGRYQKLEAPISDVAQNRLSRQEAYDTTKKSLEIWTDTVKSIRNADQLVFPLQDLTRQPPYNNKSFASNAKISLEQNSQYSNFEKNVAEVLSLTTTDLEPRRCNHQPIDSQKTKNTNARQNIARSRMERESFLRREAEAKRIKRIKSKMYRRILKREKLKSSKEFANPIGGLENTEMSDAPLTKATEYRHGKSLVHRSQGPNSDHNFQTDESRYTKDPSPSLDMTTVSKLKTVSSSSTLDDILAAVESQPGENRQHRHLHDMKFMRKPNNFRVQEDEETESSRRASSRRVFYDGLHSVTPPVSSNIRFRAGPGEATEDVMRTSAEETKNPDCLLPGQAGNQNPWLCSNPHSRYGQQNLAMVDARAFRRRLTDKIFSPGKVDLDGSSTADYSNNTGVPRVPEMTTKPSLLATDLPRKQPELVRAFAGDKVLQEMSVENSSRKPPEKASLHRNLPGWGTWCGRKSLVQQATSMTSRTTRSPHPSLRYGRLVVNKRTSKKGEKYRATSLPYPFESREQYERSLRFPVGQEWATTQAHQDLVTPKVIIKGGRAIAPLSKTF